MKKLFAFAIMLTAVAAMAALPAVPRTQDLVNDASVRAAFAAAVEAEPASPSKTILQQYVTVAAAFEGKTPENTTYDAFKALCLAQNSAFGVSTVDYGLTRSIIVSLFPAYVPALLAENDAVVTRSYKYYLSAMIPGSITGKTMEDILVDFAAALNDADYIKAVKAGILNDSPSSPRTELMSFKNFFNKFTNNYGILADADVIAICKAFKKAFYPMIENQEVKDMLIKVELIKASVN